MDASNISSGNNQIPGSLEDFARTEFLPELSVEAAVWNVALNEPGHNEPVRHLILLSAVPLSAEIGGCDDGEERPPGPDRYDAPRGGNGPG